VEKKKFIKLEDLEVLEKMIGEKVPSNPVTQEPRKK